MDLTKEQKRRIGKPSLPRPEIDLIAYRGATNDLLLIECKSYLDSAGVAVSAFDGSNRGFAKRFKLFHDENWRSIVEHRLVQQLEDTGMCAAAPRVTWVLAAGKIASPEARAALELHFAERGWQLWDVEWIASRLERIARGAYENDVVSIVAKLLERRRREERPPGRAASAPLRPKPPAVGEPAVSYRFSRLCFKGCVHRKHLPQRQIARQSHRISSRDLRPF